MAPADGSLRWSLAGTERQGSLLDDDVDPTRELREVEYLHVRARSIISEVPRASRMPFRYTINPYRGCSHACTYCFARPTHEYLGLNGARGLRAAHRRQDQRGRAARRRARAAELGRRAHRDGHEHRSLPAGRGPLPAHARHPRDARRRAQSVLDADEVDDDPARSRRVRRRPPSAPTCAANLSIGTLDEEVWRMSEPGTPPPLRRVEARRAAERGGRSVRRPDRADPARASPTATSSSADVVRACVEAGAVSITSIALHLRPGVRELFMPWLERYRPDLVERYATLYGARNGYLAREEQERVSERVRALVQRFGGCAKSPRESRARSRARAPAEGARAAARAAAARRLRLQAMPLQNRVTPFSELVAHPARGLLYGNRGCMHDDAGRICRRYGTRRWIACRLEFRGWERGPKLQPGKFTELFFLDEVTAFAAGHRPCALCRRADYVRLTRALERPAPRPGRSRRDRPPAPRRACRARARARSGITRRASATCPTARSCCATGRPGSCSARGCCAGRPRATPSDDRVLATAPRP